jgi:hypothetical protein
LLIPLLLLTFWLGARGLNADGYWVDEVWSLRTAGGPTFGPLSLSESWQRIATEDAWQAPGFYLLLNVWGGMVGWSEAATRTLSLLFGVLSVAMLYRVGRDLHSPLAGVGAAVALTTSAFYVNFYHELRGYTLYVFLTALCVWSYWKLIQAVELHRRKEPKENAGVEVAFVMSVAGLLYTHYFAALTVIVLGLYHALFVYVDLKRWREPRMWLRWGEWAWWRVGVLAGMGALLFVPWLNVLLFATQLAQRFPRYTLPPDVMVQSVVNAFSNNNVLLMLVLGLGAGLTAKAQSTQREFTTEAQRTQRGIGLVWELVIGWLVVGLGASYLLIMGEVRYFMGVWVALALLAGVGVARLAKVINPALLMGGWLVINVWNIYHTGATGNTHWDGWHEPFRELAQVMLPELSTGDSLFYQLQEGVNEWYMRDVTNYYLNGVPNVVLFEAQASVPYNVYQQQARDLVNGATRVWLALDPTTRPWRTDLLHETFMQSGFAACGNFARLPTLSVDLYANLALTAPNVSFAAQGGTIGGALLHPLPPQVGDSVAVVLGWWQDATVPPNTYSVALHVLDANGVLVAQGEDYGLPNAAAACRVARVNTGGLPSGEYTLSLVVYAWQTGARLMSAAGARVVLGTLTR